MSKKTQKLKTSVFSLTGLIKMCYWNGTEWFDMWRTTLERIVVKWMHIPYDELLIDENKLNIDKGLRIP